jgi:hypothetical protein
MDIPSGAQSPPPRPDKDLQHAGDRALSALKASKTLPRPVVFNIEHFVGAPDNQQPDTQ